MNGTRMVHNVNEAYPLVTELLLPYLLGVIAHINDTLQDVHGRKDLKEKKQVMRGLKSLISIVGPVIGRFSPQVCRYWRKQLESMVFTFIRLWQLFKV